MCCVRKQQEWRCSKKEDKPGAEDDPHIGCALTEGHHPTAPEQSRLNSDQLMVHSQRWDGSRQEISREPY